MKTSKSVLATVALVTLYASSVTTSSNANAKSTGVFQSLKGSWRGTGRVLLSGGNSQRISCRAYYSVKNNGVGLGFAIRCAAPDNKIELRGRLNDSNGRLSGTWEERTFNAVGNVTGTARTGRISLSIDGAVSGSMQISYGGRQQSVSISTATTGLKGISIKLRR